MFWPTAEAGGRSFRSLVIQRGGLTRIEKACGRPLGDAVGGSAADAADARKSDEGFNADAISQAAGIRGPRFLPMNRLHLGSSLHDAA